MTRTAARAIRTRASAARSTAARRAGATTTRALVPSRYPFQEVGERAALTQAGLRTLAQTESSAEQGRARSAVPRAFLQKVSAISSVDAPVAKFKPPTWVRALTRAKRSPQQVIDAIEQRVTQSPTRQNLLEAQMLLNDIGRLQDGGKLIRANITQQLVNQLIQKGR